MNNALLNNIARFILLLAAQIIIFNKFNLFGFINPYPYILFIILYPVNTNKNNLLIASFLLGITMDLFCNSGGVHAAACVVLAYIRPQIFSIGYILSSHYLYSNYTYLTHKEAATYVATSLCVSLQLISTWA